jgi:signal transduction histidine kinase
MESSQTHLLSLLAGLVRGAERREAARTIAQEMGAEDLIIFIPDHAISLLLPAPGFPQTFPDFTEWHEFLISCQGQPAQRGRLCLGESGELGDVLGVGGSDGSVAVLIGGSPQPDNCLSLAALLPLLTAVFNGERIAKNAESHAVMARQMAEQSRLLAGSVDRARAALRSALADAQKANHAKDRFLASLSHELRTPLTPVLLAASALREDESLPREVHQQLAMMQQNLELEVRLIDDLLDLTRIVNGKLLLQSGDCNVHLLLEHTLEILRAEITDKKISLRVAKEASKPWVRGDAARLQQVFWNLLKNAVKFTPTGGSIAVETCHQAGRIQIIVSDSGRGIARDLLPAIFKPFEQGDLKGEHLFGGLGLGLAISKAVVDMHQGLLTVQSAGKGCGATFTVDLESIETPDHVTDDDKQPHGTNTSAALRLLLVEDHPASLHVLNLMLCRSGHQVTTANSVSTASLAARDQTFDAVISDVGLPDGTGHDLMRHLRSEYGLKGIALTGYGTEDDLRNSADAGFVAHLTKPVSIARLREALHAHF